MLCNCSSHTTLSFLNWDNKVLILSYLIWSDPVIWSDLIWSYLTLPYLNLHYLTWPDLIWPDLTDLTWPDLIWSYLTLPYFTLSYLTVPYLILFYLILPYLTLPYLTLSYLIWSYFILSPSIHQKVNNIIIYKHSLSPYKLVASQRSVAKWGHQLHSLSQQGARPEKACSQTRPSLENRRA